MAPYLHLAGVHEKNIKRAVVMNCGHCGLAVFAAFRREGITTISATLSWEDHAHPRLNGWKLHDELLLQAILWIWHLVLPRVKCDGDLKAEVNAELNHGQEKQRGWNEFLSQEHHRSATEQIDEGLIYLQYQIKLLPNNSHAQAFWLSSRQYTMCTLRAIPNDRMEP